MKEKIKAAVIKAWDEYYHQKYVELLISGNDDANTDVIKMYRHAWSVLDELATECKVEYATTTPYYNKFWQRVHEIAA